MESTGTVLYSVLYKCTLETLEVWPSWRAGSTCRATYSICRALSAWQAGSLGQAGIHPRCCLNFDYEGTASCQK